MQGLASFAAERREACSRAQAACRPCKAEARKKLGRGKGEGCARKPEPAGGNAATAAADGAGFLSGGGKVRAGSGKRAVGAGYGRFAGTAED